MVAKSKPRSTNKDKMQDKRIAKLERQFPTVAEVVNNAGSTNFTNTTQSHIYSLLPALLNGEKVEFTGYNFRQLISAPSSTAGGTPPGLSVVRMIMVLYKCTVDYSGTTPAITPPVLLDILNDNGDTTQANYNPDNRNRMRILFDRTVSQSQVLINQVQVLSRKYKRSISLMPTVDRAFVHRPFLLITTAHIGSDTVQVSHDIDLQTRQLPA